MLKWWSARSATSRARAGRPASATSSPPSASASSRNSGKCAPSSSPSPRARGSRPATTLGTNSLCHVDFLAGQSAGEVEHSVEVVCAKLPGTGKEFLQTHLRGVGKAKGQRVDPGQPSPPGGLHAAAAHRPSVPYETPLL